MQVKISQEDEDWIVICLSWEGRVETTLCLTSEEFGHLHDALARYRAAEGILP